MLAPAMPSNFGNGLAMRLGQFLEALTRDFDVDLIVAPVAGAVTPEARRWAESLGARVGVLAIQDTLDTQFGLLMRLSNVEARALAFARYGLPSLAARLSITAALRCREMLAGRDYDLIHVSRSYCAPLAIALAGRPSGDRRPVLTLDLDEDDERVFRGLAAIAARQGRTVTSRWRGLEAEAFQRLTRSSIPRFDRVWVSSPADAARLQATSPTHDLKVMPNSIEMGVRSRRRDNGRTLLFVGSMSYEPNEDAVAWFLSAIWPRLRGVAGVRVRVVGSSPTNRFQRLGRQAGVEVLGWAPDLDPFYEEAALCLAPIRVGAGTRIKLLEAAVRGVPIVSTRLAAEGLGLQNRRHLWLADTPASFAAAIEDALSRPVERGRRSRAAQAWVRKYFDRPSIVARLATEFRALL
ncbi:glycosyltransferase [Phenylobacterium sp.]|uniref:glycosyltransferase n=1 Tax=Phenylobacterium sp. TaxID=1871053 RepID=UPI003BAD318E